MNFCTSLTNEQLTKYASLSRKLVSNGLKKLYELELLNFEGDKKKKYYLRGVKRTGKVFSETRFKSSQGYWAKLPFAGFVYGSGRITAFESMSNRCPVEKTSLQLVMYL